MKKSEIIELLEKHTGESGIYLKKGMIRGSDAIEAMEELIVKEISVYVKNLQEPIEDILCSGIVNCEEVDLTAKKIIDLIIMDAISQQPTDDEFANCKIPRCSVCGKNLTLVRPGKFQCDNVGCMIYDQNQNEAK